MGECHLASRVLTLSSAGTKRAVPCLGCVKSALAGLSLGECHNVAGSSARRCLRCSAGGSCEPLPELAVRSALAFLAVLETNPSYQVRSSLRGGELNSNARLQEVTKLRHRVRHLLEEAAEVAELGQVYVLRDEEGSGAPRVREKLMEIEEAVRKVRESLG